MRLGAPILRLMLPIREAQLHDAEDMEAAVVRARGHADRLSGRA